MPASGRQALEGLAAAGPAEAARTSRSMGHQQGFYLKIHIALYARARACEPVWSRPMLAHLLAPRQCNQLARRSMAKQALTLPLPLGASTYHS